MTTTETDYTYIFAGPSGAGKSTIIKEVKQRWFRDEDIVLDVADYVLAFLDVGNNQQRALGKGYNQLVKDIYQKNPTFVEVANDDPETWLPSIIGAGISGRGVDAGDNGDGRRQEVVVIYVDAPKDDCIWRNTQRERPVPDSLIREHHQYDYGDIQEIVADTASKGSLVVVNDDNDICVEVNRLAIRLENLGWVPEERRPLFDWRPLFDY